MTHNLHILLGNCAEQNISNIKKYAIKYGAEYIDERGQKAGDYLQLMLFDDNGQFYIAEKKVVEDNVFIAGIDDDFNVELRPVEGPIVGEDAAKKLIYFFDKIFSDTVVMHNSGDCNMHVSIHVPLYSDVAWANAEVIIDAINATDHKQNFTVDLLLLASDLAFLTIDDQEVLATKKVELSTIAQNTLKQIVDVKTSGKYEVLSSLILVQNHNEEGISLGLNHESYVNLVGEYALCVTLDYNSIFTMTFLSDTRIEHPVLGLGLSMLSFDRFYFVQYLLRKAYNYILDREAVTLEEVDINKVSKKAQDILLGKIDIFTRLYNDKVVPMINEKKMSHESIMAQIDEDIKAILKDFEEACTGFLVEDDLNLPEKRATLAQLLGEDDPLLQGVQYNAEQLILDECRNDVMSTFVDENNALARMPEDAYDSTGVRPIRDYAVLSTAPGEPTETVEVLIRRIKEIRHEIKTYTDYIRREEKVVDQLQQNLVVEQVSHHRLTKDGFVFEGQTYRLNPANIERPLEETYVPVAGSLPTSVDLRSDFTPIRDQQNLGSCTAFAVVAAYEYLVKRDQNKLVDLSELFAYQSARRRMLEEQRAKDEGTSIYDMVKGMGEDGICLEELHPYVTENLPEPSQEAIDDAQSRKITKALNVECKLHDLKSALSQGYPVVISLRLFESFSQTTGFVPRPTDEERQLEEHGHHAMIICGYSDQERVFIVRNSWGKRFGDKGYCYIPYSYITDPELMQQACIITEINEAEIKVVGNNHRVSVSFNTADAQVQVAIKRTLLDEARLIIVDLQAQLDVARKDYFRLVENIGMPVKRNELTEGTEERLKWEIDRLYERKTTLENERLEQLEAYDADGRSILIYSVIAVVAIVAIYTTLTFTIDGFKFSYWLTALIALGSMSLSVAPILYRRTRQFVPEDHIEKHDRNVLTVWLVSGVIGVTALLISIFFVYVDPNNLFDSASGAAVVDTISNHYNGSVGNGDLVKDVEDIMHDNRITWYDYNILPNFILSLLMFLPFAGLFLCRQGIRKALDEKYKEEIRRVASHISKRETSRNVVKLRNHIAGKILDSLTSLISRLRNKYYSMRSYVDNLRDWRVDNDEQLDMQPVNRQPFMSLIDNDCLDEYFNKHADRLTDGVRLCKLLDTNNDISEAQIIAFKNNIKKSIKEKLNASVADFSIYDYVVGNSKYEYVNANYVNIQELISTMDRNSKIFVRTSMRMSDAESDAVRCKMLFREAPGNDGSRNWDQSVETFFNRRPAMYDIASQHKIFIIRLEGLKPDELTMLR